MEQKVSQIRLSKKEVKEIKNLTHNREFIFPNEIANETNYLTGQRYIVVRINGKADYIEVGKPVCINYASYCLLKDIGIITPEKNYETGKSFDPIRS